MENIKCKKKPAVAAKKLYTLDATNGLFVREPYSLETMKYTGDRKGYFKYSLPYLQKVQDFFNKILKKFNNSWNNTRVFIWLNSIPGLSLTGTVVCLSLVRDKR